MAKIHSYLNFNGNCEEAFNFYKNVFKTEIGWIGRFGDIPEDPNVTIADADKNKIMHISININKDQMLMGSDCLESFGQKAVFGTSNYIMLDVDNADEAQELFAALTVNAQNLEMALADTFFAELFSSFTDQFGIAWMIHFEGNRKFQ
ncbi:VOC family protein [Sphingobacterium bovistauri]|uniref:VOC family protein n=1 Tax=Sphingobacterium bovistauri TaxID=2781959 RepID=A0ABS7Z4K8_9SPHI|nr:VOC family protein [Sphingobacterium bovistauri]MCA5005115.1 VOC family protein [Sphingobacterium bovistauri]